MDEKRLRETAQRAASMAEWDNVPVSVKMVLQDLAAGVVGLQAQVAGKRSQIERYRRVLRAWRPKPERYALTRRPIEDIQRDVNAATGGLAIPYGAGGYETYAPHTPCGVHDGFKISCPECRAANAPLCKHGIAHPADCEKCREMLGMPDSFR